MEKGFLKNVKKTKETGSQIAFKKNPKITQQERLIELDKIAKMLVRRDLELSKAKEQHEKELEELDRIAKMLVRRDLELTELREEREREFQELQKRTKELEDSRRALINILEDVEGARVQAVEEGEKTQAIITNFTDGLLLFDRENNFSLINPQARIFFEIGPREVKRLEGKPLFKLDKIPKLTPLVKILKERGERKVFRKELRLKENLILEVSTVLIVGEKEVIGTLVILHDITKEKMIERMKTEFVSITAHQLRTPLSAVKWTLRMLLDGDLGQITEEQSEFIEKTYRSNERMIHIINDLLNVTRIEEGRFVYNIKREDLIRVSKEVLKIPKEMAKRNGLEFEFKVPKEGIPSIRLDVEKIALAIQNLVENAISYTKRGGKVVVSVEHDKKDKKILFTVKDTGIGIPKDQRTRVFDKFFRADNAVKARTEGSGLGLFTAKNIIEAHGGRIWFESKEGKGTSVYFTLPVRSSEGE